MQTTAGLSDWLGSKVRSKWRPVEEAAPTYRAHP
jgi:hypothetical protein